MDEFDPIESAIAAYKTRLETRPDELSNYWNLGLAFLLNHEDFAAQEVWFAGITADDAGESDRRLAALIEFLKRKSRDYQKNYYPERSELIDYQLLDLDGDSPEIYVHLGEAIALQGRLDEAIGWWVKATEIQPDLFDVYCRCGIGLQKLGKFTDALHFYITALSLKSDPEIFYRLGICYLKTEQLQNALDTFRRAIAIAPNCADTIADLGWVLLRLRRHEEGMHNWKSALQIKPDFARFYGANLADSERDRIRVEFLNGLLGNCQTTDFLQLLKKLVSFHEKSPERQHIPPSNPAEPPQLFYELTRDWAVSANQQYQAIEPETTVRLKPPKTPDNSVHFSFRFGSKLTLPASFITVIPKGRYWLDSTQTQSAVITENNRFLADLSPDFPILSPRHPDKHPSRHSILSLKTLPEIEDFAGNIAVLSGLSNDIYFHWMLDILPKIGLLQNAGFNLSEIDGFIVRDRLPFQRETLDILNIPKTRRINPIEHPHIRGDRLIVPSFSGHISWPNPQTLQWLKRQFLEIEDTENNDNFDRIYISRKSAKTRRILNEDEIIESLRKYGFQTVHLETLSVVEQARLFHQAKVIVAPHGSGLTNLVFCQSGTIAIELFSPHYVYHCYWWLSNLVGLNYYYCLGETLPGEYLQRLLYPKSVSEDIAIAPRQLLDVLKFAGVV